MKKKIFKNLVFVTVMTIFICVNVYAGGLKNVKVTASSYEKDDPKLKPENAVDGKMSTRWGSAFGPEQWLSLNLGEDITITGVLIKWETAYAKSYNISVSSDGKNWKQVYNVNNADGGKDIIYFPPVSARYVKLNCRKRGLDWAGYSLFEIELYNDKDIALLNPGSQEFGILKNQSFEDREEGWQTSGTVSHLGIHEWSKYTGVLSFGIGNDKGPDNAYGEIYQYLDIPGKIKKGDLVIFSIWLRGEIRYTGEARVIIEFFDAGRKILKSFQSEPVKGTFPWKKVTVTGEAPEGTDHVRVKCRSEKMASSKGGSFIWVDNAGLLCPVISASSFLKDREPVNIMREGEWRSEPSENESITIDFRKLKRISGLSIDWSEDYAEDYEILVSQDGKIWNNLCKVEKNKDRFNKIYVDAAVIQYVKIQCQKTSKGKGIGIKKVDIMEASELITLDKYSKILAEQLPGCFPRWLLNQAAWWTDVGVEGDSNEAVLCEDGIMEPHKRGFTIIPFIYQDNLLITRDESEVTQSLENECLPIPSVKWNYKDVEMNVKLFTSGKRLESIAYAIYKIENKRNEKVEGKLYLTIRPYQIFPPWQEGGGPSPIYNVEYRDNVITVNDTYQIFPLSKPEDFGAISGSQYFKFPFKTPSPPDIEGDITSLLKKGIVPEETDAADSRGLVSSVLVYDYKLEPGESKEYYIAVPLHKKDPELNVNMSEEEVKNGIYSLLEKNIAYWTSRVNNFKIDIPEKELVNMLKSSICYNLITKDGPGFQPGSRSYDKVWIRDGGMAAAAMLKMGLTTEVREFIDWYCSYQYDSGLVPPIIDTKRADPLWEEKPPKNLIEYDCQGEFIFTIMQYYNFTHDMEFLKEKFDNVKRAFEYQMYLRKQTLTDEFKNGDPEKEKYYGILPPSTSHEGYGCEYSYWDDFWGLKGYKDAYKMFKILGKTGLAETAKKEYEDFKKCFYKSAELTMKYFKINYFPASASLGDMDPTSTAVAVMYCDELENMPKTALKNTFDAYYADLSSRFELGAEYRFTPYELRNVPAFLFMGQKKRALELIRFMVSCRRPLNWNQLAEVVNSDYRYPEYVGDIPHTWVSAEYVNGFRSMFVYEMSDKLILAHGVDEKWLNRKQGISVKNILTYYGKISYSIRKTGDDIHVNISGEAEHDNGFIFKSPYLNRKIKEVKVNGKSWKKFNDDSVTIDKLPADIVITY